MRQNKLLFPSFLTLLLILTGFSLIVGQRVQAETAVDPGNAPDWEDPEMISGTIERAQDPQIAVSPSGNRVIIGFERRFNMSGTPQNNDPYYVIRNGPDGTWSNPAKIHDSPTEFNDSVDVQVGFDASDVAHAVWVEGAAGEQLVHAPEGDWPTNNTSNLPTVISEPLLPPGASSPVLKIEGNTLNVIWSEGAAANPNIYFARSPDSGVSWPASLKHQVTSSSAESRVPALAVDPGDENTLYTVWEEQAGTVMSPTTNILFSQITVINNNSVTHTLPVRISPQNQDGSFSEQPNIFADSQGIHATFSYRKYDPQSETDVQFVWYTTCRSNCSEQESWTSPINISGPFVLVNDNLPFFLIPQIEAYRGCIYVYYHGIDRDLLPEQNELVWGVNSCDSWNANGNERLTDPATTRAVNPSVTSGADGRIYLTYSEVVAQDDLAIFVMSGERPVTLFLPIISRQ